MKLTELIHQLVLVKTLIIMIMIPVNVKNVTTNVILVTQLMIVKSVLEIPDLLHQNVYVYLDYMTVVLLNVWTVTQDV